MVVKDDEDAPDTSRLDESPMTTCLKIINQDSRYLSPKELVINCKAIVNCIGKMNDGIKGIWSFLQTVEEYLVRVVSSVSPEIRREIIAAIVESLFEVTAQIHSETCPTVSVVLVVIDHDLEGARAAARRVVEREDPGVNMRSSLSCFFTWVLQWDGTPPLAHWLKLLINALEENGQFALLTEVSLEHLINIISILDDPSSLTESIVDLILHVLASLRECMPALDAIASTTVRVLNDLASESGQFSRQLLQDLVDIITVMVNTLHPIGSSHSWDIMDLRSCLNDHMASSCCEYLKLAPWPAASCGSRSGAGRTAAAADKVGLANLGNTCYMNSVMQALLHTSQFSVHVMTKMANIPYWANMAILFAKLRHSLFKTLDPRQFFVVAKPPYFNTDKQHDSSEFLGYLFQLLQSYEDYTDFEFDYSEPSMLPKMPKPCARTRGLAPIVAGQTSPRGDSGSGPSKRSLPDNERVPPKKRLRSFQAPVIRDASASSFIDLMFGGVLMTRIKCTECHSTSVSRDLFRDLQLAFPDMPEQWPHSVQTLLNYYCATEMLIGDNKYYCASCGSLRDAEKSVLIENSPKYLILVLKNFRFDPKRQVQTKLMHRMSYTQLISLPSVRSSTPQCKYSMYAAVIHCGDKLDTGHYFTVAKEPEGWFEYNDERVTEVNETQINRLAECCTPYVLFYKRGDVDDIPAPELKDLPPKLQECVMAHNKPYETVNANAQISRPRPIMKLPVN